MQFTISLNFFLLLVALSRWKITKFQITMKFYLKNLKTFCESLISPSFHVLYCSPKVYMKHLEPLFQDLPFCCTKKVPKNHNQPVHFCQGGGTHFLVLAQTMIWYDRFWDFRCVVLTWKAQLHLSFLKVTFKSDPRMKCSNGTFKSGGTSFFKSGIKMLLSFSVAPVCRIF